MSFSLRSHIRFVAYKRARRRYKIIDLKYTVKKNNRTIPLESSYRKAKYDYIRLYPKVKLEDWKFRRGKQRFAASAAEWERRWRLGDCREIYRKIHMKEGWDG